MDEPARSGETDEHAMVYTPPTIIDLGTLAELTLGAAGGTADGVSAGGVSGGVGSSTLQ